MRRLCSDSTDQSLDSLLDHHTLHLNTLVGRKSRHDNRVKSFLNIIIMVSQWFKLRMWLRMPNRKMSITDKVYHANVTRTAKMGH